MPQCPIAGDANVADNAENRTDSLSLSLFLCTAEIVVRRVI